MKGWVYIITNKAMPDLVKVGFSTKDPIDRAKELSTGSPHPYIVEYEICVENPQKIEKSTHEILSFINEGKEWFRCNIETAIKAIRKSCNDEVVIVERILNEYENDKFSKNPIVKNKIENKKIIASQLPIPFKNKKENDTKKTINELSTIIQNNTDNDLGQMSVNQLLEKSKKDVEAEYELGLRYDTGNGVRKSLKDGFKYFLLAAGYGHTLAELAAGKAYLTGRGTEKDIYQALVFLKKAADKDNTEAQCLFGINVDFIDIAEDEKYKKLKKEWCPNESSDDFSVAYIRKACVKNYPPAQFALGLYFDNQNDSKYAFELYERAAKNGHILAQRYLADCYLEGLGCKKNNELAKKWYQKAAEGKDSIAKKKLDNWEWHSQF